jgi:hypothetical protein
MWFMIWERQDCSSDSKSILTFPKACAAKDSFIPVGGLLTNPHHLSTTWCFESHSAHNKSVEMLQLIIQHTVWKVHDDEAHSASSAP